MTVSQSEVPIKNAKGLYKMFGINNERNYWIGVWEGYKIQCQSSFSMPYH